MKKNENYYEITRRIAVLSGESGGYSKELNMVKWDGRDAEIDIRRWGPDKPFKGIALNQEEARLLLKYLKEELEEEDA